MSNRSVVGTLDPLSLSSRQATKYHITMLYYCEVNRTCLRVGSREPNLDGKRGTGMDGITDTSSQTTPYVRVNEQDEYHFIMSLISIGKPSLVTSKMWTLFLMIPDCTLLRVYCIVNLGCVCGCAWRPG